MMTHTKEPWEPNGFQVRQAETRWPICQLPLDDFDYKSNARRIVDCVNALAGIPDPAGLVASHRQLVGAVADWLLYLEGDGDEGFEHEAALLLEMRTALANARSVMGDVA
jgi:hypothetical protein